MIYDGDLNRRETSGAGPTTLPEHLSSPPFSVSFYVLLVHLQFRASEYPFNIFKLFLTNSISKLT